MDKLNDNSNAIGEDYQSALRWQSERYFPVDVPVDNLISQLSEIVDENNNYNINDLFNPGVHPAKYWDAFESAHWSYTRTTGFGCNETRTNTDTQQAVFDIIESWVEQYFKFKPEMISLQGIKSNIPVNIHTDHTSRSTIIVVPFTEKNFYGTTHYHENKGAHQVPFMECFAFNTQIPHETPPVPQNRLFISLWYSNNIEEMLDIYQSNNLLI